jgi:hypothetical protein
MVIANSAIELDNMVLIALRKFTVSCMFRARTVSGHRITTARLLKNEQEVSALIPSVVNTVKFRRLNRPAQIPRHGEPTVRDPNQTERVFQSCGASNLASLQNALALNLDLFRDIATVRNFYAHRNEDTWRKVRANTKSH